MESLNRHDRGWEVKYARPGLLYSTVWLPEAGMVGKPKPVRFFDTSVGEVSGGFQVRTCHSNWQYSKAYMPMHEAFWAHDASFTVATTKTPPPEAALVQAMLGLSWAVTAGNGITYLQGPVMPRLQRGGRIRGSFDLLFQPLVQVNVTAQVDEPPLLLLEPGEALVLTLYLQGYWFQKSM